MERQAGWNKADFGTVYNVFTHSCVGRAVKTPPVVLAEEPLLVPLRQAASQNVSILPPRRKGRQVLYLWTWHLGSRTHSSRYADHQCDRP